VSFAQIVIQLHLAQIMCPRALHHIELLVKSLDPDPSAAKLRVAT